MPPRAIAIDGPAAAGKTTVGRRLAQRLGYLFLDTGVLYRALTAAAVDASVSTDDEAGLVALAGDVALELEQTTDGPAYRVTVASQDVTDRLRRPEVDRAVSAVSAHANVRRALLPLQRRVALQSRVVMVGRDIASVVLPDADVKIYLDASAPERARRRLREALRAGAQLTHGAVLAEIMARDQRDSSRLEAPLAVAPDAIVVNTEGCTLEQTVEHLGTLLARWPQLEIGADTGAPCQ